MQNSGERRLEEDVEKGEHAEEVELGGILGDGGGNELAEAGAGEDHGDERGGTLAGDGAGHGDGDHAAKGVFADHEEGFADGGDDAGMMLEGGVGEAQHAIAEGGIGGDDFFELAEIGGGVVELREEVEVDEVVLGDGVGCDEDGLGKEVSLEEGAAFRDGDVELGIGFDLLGDELTGGAGGEGIDFAAGEKVGGSEVDLDEVGEGEERSAGGAGKKAVEGEAIAFGFEGEAAVDEGGIGVDVFEDFEDGGLGGKEGDEAVDECGAGAVDEGGDLVGLGNEHEPVVDDLAGGELGIAGEVVDIAGAVEELVAEEAALGVEDRLGAEETAGRARSRIAVGWSRRGFS